MHSPPVAPAAGRTAKLALAGFIIIWFGFQILFPFRYLLYPGNPSWTEEGHRFAWMMKLRDKRANAVFMVRDPATGDQWEVVPHDLLLRHQAIKVASRPDMILQYAHYIERHAVEQRGIADVEVRAHVCASLNGRPPALLIDPTRDLTKIERNLRHADWILPLDQPFDRPPERTRRRDLSCGT